VTHDLETVLDGLIELRRTDTGAFEQLALVLVGDGVEREELEAKTRALGLERVRFHPAIPKGAIPRILDQSDACLMQAGASDYFKYGLSPNKLFDYFAAGKPVLISSAYPTVVDETQTGLRFEPGEPTAFADAVVRLMELPASERQAMGARGKELVRTRYSISSITDTYEDLLKEVIAERRR